MTQKHIWGSQNPMLRFASASMSEQRKYSLDPSTSAGNAYDGAEKNSEKA